MTPFWRLVEHFVKRLTASEEEEGTESTSLGLGMVLAILASPGAFASILLMDKYSPLLQWLRGIRHFNAFKSSAADEYFFIVLSMTITGLVMVLRWNKLLPDRRDFWNLAVLPIPIRDVFLANFAALLGLAFVFAIDVNAVSSFLFPIFVTMGHPTVTAFLQVAAAHAAAVFSASLFSFFAVLSLVGLLMLLLPARLFRPVSVAVRMLLVVTLLSEFFSNLFLELLSGRSSAHAGSYARFLPSFWFLGVYENVLHTAQPAIAQLGNQALAALAASIVIAVAAYSLCYRRHFLRLAESFDTLGGSRHVSRLPLPQWLGRVLFRSRFEEACSRFSLKVLLRSERHVMLFGGYLGIGLVIVAQALFDRTNNVLEVPLLLTFFLISGLRLVFETPAVLAANWVFRTAPTHPHPSPEAMARRFLRLAVLPWQAAILAPIAAHRLGWPAGLKITAMDMALSVLAIDLLLWNFHKIAFTYIARPDAKQIILRMLAALFAVALLIPLLVSVEQWALSGWLRLALIAALAGAAFFEIARRKRQRQMAEQVLTFEEGPAAAFELLKLA
ncbi:MAG TPA: hypothetical protein VGL97_11610 [Bryobacteraceae bacterium]|jgi:hypothetical protein